MQMTILQINKSFEDLRARRAIEHLTLGVYETLSKCLTLVEDKVKEESELKEKLIERTREYETLIELLLLEGKVKDKQIEDLSIGGKLKSRSLQVEE